MDFWEFLGIFVDFCQEVNLPNLPKLPMWRGDLRLPMWLLSFWSKLKMSFLSCVYTFWHLKIVRVYPAILTWKSKKAVENSGIMAVRMSLSFHLSSINS